jgi:hypothetical protein
MLHGVRVMQMHTSKKVRREPHRDGDVTDPHKYTAGVEREWFRAAEFNKPKAQADYSAHEQAGYPVEEDNGRLSLRHYELISIRVKQDHTAGNVHLN